MKTVNFVTTPQKERNVRPQSANTDRFLMSVGGSVAGGAFLGAMIYGVIGAIAGAAVGLWAALPTLRGKNG